MLGPAVSASSEEEELSNRPARAGSEPSQQTCPGLVQLEARQASPAHWVASVAGAPGSHGLPPVPAAGGWCFGSPIPHPFTELLKARQEEECYLLGLLRDPQQHLFKKHQLY